MTGRSSRTKGAAAERRYNTLRANLASKTRYVMGRGAVGDAEALA